MRELECDIAIIGSSLGGCAAAMSALSPQLSDGLRVCLVADTRWVGGQISAQGVAPLDEHRHIETFGAPARYLDFRQRVRMHYHSTYGAPLVMRESVLGADMPLNPGNGWVSRLCYTPRVGKDIIESMLPDALQRFGVYHAVESETHDGTVHTIICQDDDGQRLRVSARYVLDATDLGDLLPLTHTDYVSGAESRADTDEPDAPDSARPHETQGITYCFAVEFCAGENHTITPPPDYVRFRDSQPYTLSPTGRDGQAVVYHMFNDSAQGNLPFWSYRRIHDGALLGGNDIALINWGSNDYHGGGIIDVSPNEREAQLKAAKALSLGFLYWLQTECPRDEGGIGYPELKLRPDVMGTDDGLSQAPYIRESRRIRGLTRITQQDIAAEYQDGARARHYPDSVGIGWYAMDLHPCVDNPSVSLYAPTRPFQIPLGALIPSGTHNLIAACKNIATTHLTNGAYRLQPVEWAIGEAAGALAAFCTRTGLTPQQVHADDGQVWRLQYQLVAQGVPIVWAVDVPTTHPLFMSTQLLLARDLIVPQSSRWHTLEIGLDQPLGDSIALDKLRGVADALKARLDIHPDMTWATLCARLSKPLTRALSLDPLTR
jgi:hypothetical protein